MNPTESSEPVPIWLASRIRRAALLSALCWLFPVAAVALLLAGIEAAWWFKEMESTFIPLFWNAVFLGLLYLFGREFFTRIWIFLRPELSEEAAYLRRFGTLTDVVNRVEGELQDPAHPTFGKEVAFTENWLIVSGGRRFALRRLDDLIWVFLKKSTTRLNAVIPIWRSNWVAFHSADGPDVEAKCSPEQGTKLLEHAAQRCPWIVLGHDEAKGKLWESDRAAFVAAVQDRKKGGAR